ncbi:MAG: PAAR domain-containing protein [Dechloromonas sp.]|nr:MAG: PAAR domain-containing protein [Dechloromonas sp.]
MTRPFILLGDKTSHGGVVISASETTDSKGKGIARVGDKVTCPLKGHGSVTTIATGDSTALIDGKPAARHGDLTACGASLIAGQSMTTD